MMTVIDVFKERLNAAETAQMSNDRREKGWEKEGEARGISQQEVVSTFLLEEKAKEKCAAFAGVVTRNPLRHITSQES